MQTVSVEFHGTHDLFELMLHVLYLFSYVTGVVLDNLSTGGRAAFPSDSS